MTVLRIGTRASSLAHAQSTLVATALERALGVDVELVDIRSEGDRSSRPLTEIGGQGVFVGAVREALVDGSVDVVVHSLKDLPTMRDDRVTLAAVPQRGDPRDALVARDGLTLAGLPAGSRIGTGSPRREAQLHALGLGLDVVPIRGNVDTRVRQVLAGELDGVVVARAGLVRLGREAAVTETIDPIQMLPAPGQGALAVEVSATAGPLADDVSVALDHADSRTTTCAERALLRALGAGCSAPVGALAEVAEGDDGLEVWLRGVVVAPDGSHLVRLSASGPVSDPDGVGLRLAQEMLAEGAAGLMQERAS
ncbi:MAG: hydroxymethylbilane synthase [Propionibacteriales bacterium]|jgi:hydroxymethylbilane synthase|nr:hydroxymethylbilane synthase [Propionibacteriales bacterium]